jgi:tetratricopeptide (TPR) repeat protein
MHTLKIEKIIKILNFYFSNQRSFFMRSKSVFRSLITLIVLTTLFTGCSSIGSFFKGSGKSYDSAVVEWEKGSYVDSMYHMIRVVQNDPEYAKAKDFIKIQFQIANDKTLELIKMKEADKSDPLVKSQEVFNLYQGLNRMVTYAKKIVPLVGPKETWVWDPDLSEDYVEGLEASRKVGVELRISEIQTLFASEKSEEARVMIKNVMGDYLDAGANDSEAEITLRDVTAKQIANLVKNATKKMLSSDQTEVLQEGLKLLDLALIYSPNDEEVAVIRTQIEDKLVSAIIAEGKELEEKGDIKSLESAREKYELAYKKYPGCESLNQAINAVKVTIGNMYYANGYELEQIGDEESLKKARNLYESVLKYKKLDEDARFYEAFDRATVALAEISYQRALELEPAIGNDIQKGQTVISAYQDAQEWVENYKDTEQRIAAVKEAITVNVYVLAQQGELFRSSEIELANALKKKFNYFYYFTPATDENRGFSPSMVEDDSWISPAKSKGLTYMVILTGKAGSVQYNVKEEQENLKINYKINLDGTIEELSSGSFSVLNAGKALYKGTDAAYLKSMSIKGYGTANITVSKKTKASYRDFYTEYKVVNVDDGATVYESNLTTKFNMPSQTITSSVTSDNSQLRTWYLKTHNTTIKTSFVNDPTEESWVALYKKNADFVTNKATAIAKAISEERT